MRTGWLLLAAVCALARGFERDENVQNVLSTWSDNEIQMGDHWVEREGKEVKQTVEDEIENIDHHGRSKRSANPFIFAAAQSALRPIRSCYRPGYTGELCTTPVCDMQNQWVWPNNPSEGEGAKLDAAFLGANCTNQYVTVIDDRVYDVMVSLTSTGMINPNLDLIDSDGKHWFVDQIVERSPQQFAGLFEFLPPGVYYVNPTPDVQNAPCHLEITAKTMLTIEGGFVSTDNTVVDGVRNDFPDTKYVRQGTPSIFVVHAHNQESPGKLAAVTIFEGNNVVSRTQLLETRYNCSYEYFHDSFYCRNTGSYYYLVEGITHRGFPYRRLGSFACLVNPDKPTVAPTGSTPAPTSPTSCANGGMLVKNFDGSAFCLCRGLWTGASCDQVQCMNGGTPMGGRCQCASGYEGMHCQDVMCLDRGNSQFDVDHPTMIFVIRARKQMQDVINAVRDKIILYANRVDTWDPEYVKKFGVVFYNNGNIEHMRAYDSLKGLIGAFDRYASNLTDTSGNCTDVEFGALAAALQAVNVSPRSVVYVITDAMPGDYNADLETVFHLDSYWRVPLYFIYVEGAPGTQCYPSVDDPGFRAMDDITQRTMGLAFYVSNRSEVANLFYKHLDAIFYRSQLMLTDDLQSCANQNLFKTVAVDVRVDQMVVVAKGKGLSLFVSGENVRFNLTYQSGDTYIWSAWGITVGNYMFNFLSTSGVSPCSYRIYQKSANSPSFKNQQYELFWAFTPAMNEDGILQQPVVGLDTGIVMHLKNYPREIPAERVHAELLIYASRRGRQEEIYMSNGIWRDGCDYNFYFPPLTCRNGREVLNFQFFAKDDIGFMIQRAGSMYCSEYHPTFLPPSACQNGGVPSPADNSTCFCPPGFTGDKCQTIVCINGGTPQFGLCMCPPGFAGSHCQFTACIEKGPPPTIFLQGVDMVFAVEITQVAYPTLHYINQNFPETIRDIQSQHPRWIRNFVLLAFNSTWGGVIVDTPAFTPNVIINAMNNLANTLPSDQGCVVNSNNVTNPTVKTWHALSYALMHRNVRPGSFINLYSVSPPDQTNIMDIVVMYNAAREMGVQITSSLGYLPSKGGSFYCGATLDDFRLLHDAARFSNGESYFLQQATVADFVRTIPAKFMSGTVVHRRFDDCTGPVYVALPIDAYTQTIQIATEGYKTAMTLYSSRGKLAQPTLLASDSTSGWNFYEQRAASMNLQGILAAACDPDWELVASSCVHFGFNPNTWDDARAVCQHAGGFLADDMTADKHAYIAKAGSGHSFWFGLNNKNGQGWAWDRANASAQPLATQAYWNGGNAPTDASQQCAYFDSSAPNDQDWFGAQCNTRRSYMCQKHAYTYNYVPNSVDDDDLPAGKWFLQLQTQLPDNSTKLHKGCFVEVRVQSHLQVMTGFNEDTHQDYPDADPVVGSTNNHLVSFVGSAADYRARTPILTHGLIFNAHNDTMYDAVTFAPRSMCAFDWISQPFSCPDSDNEDNLFSVIHVGEDEFGHTFQRIVNGHCTKPTITCGNGGLRYNGTCVCTEYWQGKYCSIPTCVNGGVLDQTNRRCNCPAGFSGSACEYNICPTPANYTFSTGGRTLVLLVEQSVQNKDAMQNLADNIETIIAAATTGSASDWFSGYVLTTFGSKGILFTQSFQYASSLAPALQSRIAAAEDTTTCGMPIFGAVASVFDDPKVMYGSEILLVTASVPTDTANRFATIAKMNGASPRIHSFFIATSGCNNGNSIPTGDDALHFNRFVYATNGNNFFVNSTVLPHAMTSYLPTVYHANTLSHPTYGANFTCAAGTWYVQIDNNSSDIYITTASSIGSIAVINPMKQRVLADPIFSWDQQKFYHISNQYAGIYTFNLSSPGACYVNIQATGGARVWHAFVQPSSADPTGAHTDAVTLDAASGLNVAVFHVQVNDQREHARLTYMDMWDPVKRVAVRTELFRRGNCHFEYYSEPFNCVSMEGFYMAINGVDELGQNFRRQSTAFCSGNGTQPTIVPPPLTTTTASPLTTITRTTVMPTTTRVGPTLTTTTGMPMTSSYGYSDIRADIVFAIDVSKTGAPLIDDFINFIKTFLVAFTVGQDKVRVGVVPVFGESGLTSAVAPLSAVSSSAQLFTYLNSLKEFYNDFDVQGQYLAEALNLIASQDFSSASAGYRADIKNHVVIYLTGTTTFNDDPKTVAQYMLSMKKYGLIGVSYKGGDRSVLANLFGSNTCAYVPADNGTLMQAVLRMLQIIVFDNDQTGQYCGNPSFLE